VPGRAVAEPAPIAPANEAVAVSPPIDIYAEHAKWMALAGQRDFDGAIELCLSTIKAPDTSFVASLFLGYAYFQSGRPSEAQRHLIPAVALNAGDFYANLLLAHVEKALGAPREALARYMTCCTLDAASVVEPFEAAMDIALPMREAEEGEALSTLFDKLHAADKLPDPLVLKFLFFWRRDADLVGLLVRAEEAGKPKASFRHVRTVQDWALAHGENYVSLGEPVSIRLVTPTETYRDAPKEKHVLGSAPYIAEVRNASIVGNSSLIYAGDADVLSDVLAHPLYGEQVSLAYDKTVIAQRSDALLLAQQGASERLDEGIMLSGLASNAYGHWFAEFLPKLRYFERNPRFEQLPIIVDAGMPQSHFDFLAALVGNPLHRIESGQVLEVGCLHVAPTTTFFPVELFRDHGVPPEHQASWSAESMQYIKDRIAKGRKLPGQRSRRLFLSRKNSSWRLLRNESELIEDLQSMGFETVFMEELDFEHQVRTFGEAEFVVAPNGSALNSLIFAAPEVKALILGQQNSFNWGGWLGPMLDLGFNPEFLEGEAVESTDFKHSDYVVSVAKVHAKVHEMLHS